MYIYTVYWRKCPVLKTVTARFWIANDAVLIVLRIASNIVTQHKLWKNWSLCFLIVISWYTMINDYALLEMNILNGQSRFFCLTVKEFISFFFSLM